MQADSFQIRGNIHDLETKDFKSNKGIQAYLHLFYSLIKDLIKFTSFNRKHAVVLLHLFKNLYYVFQIGGMCLEFPLEMHTGLLNLTGEDNPTAATSVSLQYNKPTPKPSKNKVLKQRNPILKLLSLSTYVVQHCIGVSAKLISMPLTH